MALLLAVVAVFLIDRNRRFLVGEEVRPEVRQDVLRQLLDRPDIDRITYLHLEFVGPGRLYLVASVDMAGDDVELQSGCPITASGTELEEHENIEEAVPLLATPDEAVATSVTRLHYVPAVSRSAASFTPSTAVDQLTHHSPGLLSQLQSGQAG